MRPHAPRELCPRCAGRPLTPITAIVRLQAVFTLRRQYRMAADIQALPNALVYSGELRCGSDEVANARLALPWLAQLLHGSGPALATPRWAMEVGWLSCSMSA